MAKFIYGGTTGETPETIARKREVALAMMARQGTPRDIGEGLNAIGDALLARRMYKGAGRAEEAGRATAPKFGFDPVMSALTRQSPAASGGNSVMAALDPKAPASVEGRMGGRPFDAVREALIKQESGGNPNAISPKGAVGVTQVMPDTAMDPGFGVPSVFDIAQAKGIQVASRDKATAIELLKNPQINEELGGKYFDAMANRYGGDLQQAAAAYNGGPGRLDSVGGNIGRMPAETQAYVPAVTGGQPQQVAQAGGGMFDPEVYNQAMAVLQHPFADPQSKAAAQAYVEQAQRQADPKYQLEVRKLEKDVQDDGKPWYIRPDGSVDPAYIEASRATKSDTNITLNDQKLTEGQSKDVGFYYRGSLANEDLGSIEQSLTQIDQNVAAQFGTFGKFYTSPEFKQAKRAASEFLAVILRKDTGAAVTEQEFDLYGPMYLPGPGEDPQTLAAKREARTRALDAIYMGLGTARNLGDDVKTELQKRRAAPPAAPGAPGGETVIDGYTIKPKGQ
jgi:hypothetical protein